jgi:hypothetical protein
MNKRKVLVLSYTREDVIRSVRYVNELRDEGTTVVVLGLDFGSWAELRRRNMPYKTPAAYLDRSKCPEIDAQAVALARSWYSHISEEMTYHGICLGEIAEYDFRHLFVDALRAVEIADCIVDAERPDGILLPRNVPAAQPNAVRYEALRNAVIHRARSKGIQLSYVDPSPERPIGPVNDLSGKLSLFPKCFAKARRNLRHIRSQLGSRTRRYSQSGRIILFVGVPDQVFLPIKNELDRNPHNIASRIDACRFFATQRRDANPETETMIERCREVEKKARFGQDLIYANVQLAEILAPRFSQFFLKECPELVRCIEGMEAFIKRARPSILVTMEDVSPICRILVRVCKMRGVATLVIQHGMTAADPGVHPVLPFEADVQAVWGNLTKEWAIKRGKSPESQVITGNPRYDFIAHRRGTSDHARIALSRSLDLNEGTIVVVAPSWYEPVTSSYTPERDEAFLRNTLATLKTFPEVQVVVKLHPMYSSEYEAMTRAVTDELQTSTVVTNCFLWELLETCDLLITDTSTVALEAILFEKPVITFSPDLGLGSSAYAETESIINVDKKAELVRAIRDALYDRDVRGKLALARKQAIYQYAYCQDGKASQRVAQLIEVMVCRASSIRRT